MGKNRTPYGQYYKKPINEEPVVEETSEVVEKKIEEHSKPVEEKIESIAEEPKRIFAAVHGSSKVNMRKQPSTGSKIIKVLEQGSEVELVLPVATGIWTKIHHEGETGWMMARYLKRV